MGVERRASSPPWLLRLYCEDERPSGQVPEGRFAPRNAGGRTKLAHECKPAKIDGANWETERMVVATGKRGLSPIYLDRAAASAQPEIMARRKYRKRIVFGWYGGKFSHLDWLLPLLPRCTTIASRSPVGAVLLNREPAPVETYNDIDGEVVNFFRVLREDPEG